MAANSSIEQYLKTFLKNEPTGFAVSLNGDWGTGKTYFVNNFIKQHKSENKEFKSLYVSLAGCSSSNQIEDQIFRAVLGFDLDTNSTLSTSIIKNLAKLSIEPFGAKSGGKGTLEALAATAGEAILEKAKKTCFDFLENKVNLVIFDDIERTRFRDYYELVGVINQYVEHDSKRVLIIVNEAELDKPKKKSSYLRVKEKIIGHELRFVPDIEGALESLVELTSFPNAINRSVLESVVPAIKSAQEKGFVKINLRTVRRTLYDLKIISQTLSEEITELDFKSLFHDIYCLKYALANRSISFEDLEHKAYFNYFQVAAGDDRSKGYEKTKKFDENLKNWHCSTEMLAAICEFWKTGATRQFRLVLDSKYGLKPPSEWFQLWNFYDLIIESDLVEILNQCHKKIDNGTIDDIGEILHIYCSEIGLNVGREDEINRILDSAEKTLLNLNADSIENYLKRRTRPDSYHGYRYNSIGTESAQKLLKSLEDILIAHMDQKINEIRLNISQDLLKGKSDQFQRYCNILRVENEDKLIWGKVQGCVFFTSDFCDDISRSFSLLSFRDMSEILTTIIERFNIVEPNIASRELKEVLRSLEAAIVVMKAGGGLLGNIKADQASIELKALRIKYDSLGLPKD